MSDYYTTNPDGSKCTSWVQHPVTGKLIPRSRYQRDTDHQHMIMKSIEPFVSPIDRKEISCRSKLREHNAKHGVTNAADYDGGYIKRRQKAKLAEQARHSKADRRETLMKNIHRFS